MKPRVARPIIKRVPLDRLVKIAEIGVYTGNISAAILLHRPYSYLTMIDPWPSPKSGDHYYETGGRIAIKMAENAEVFYQQSLDATAFANARRTVLRTTSLHAASILPNSTFDMVFLDGDHTYKAVAEDLVAWRPKVKDGGWLCGHDFRNRHPCFGVKQAVCEFADVYKLTIERERPGSCWFIRV